MLVKRIKQLLPKKIKIVIRSIISILKKEIDLFLPIFDKVDSSFTTKCWITEHHLFTTQCFKSQLRDLEVAFYDYCLSGQVRFFYTKDPSKGLRILDKYNTNKPYDYNHYEKLAISFAKKYNKWSQKKIDFYWCSFKAYMVHVFSKCDRPIVLQIAFRFEGNIKCSPENMKKLIELFLKLRDKRQLTILASNSYDQKYFEYFTAIKIPVIPLCARNYIQERYQPIRNEILIGPGRSCYQEYKSKISNIKEFFIKNKSEIEVKEIRELYPNYKYSDLCKHKAIIVLPYTVYTGSIVEYLTMGIPIFMPTSDLLSQWHSESYILRERKSNLNPTKCSIIKGKLSDTMLDPNDDYDIEAIKYWVKFCEWYKWPIETFKNLEELEQKLLTVNLQEVSRKMLKFDQQQYYETSVKWKKILKEIKNNNE